MFKRLIRSRVALVVVTATVTAVVAGGISWALQDPVDGDGVVHACYNAQTGALRLMVTPTCPKGERTPIEWNQAGLQGEPGPSDTWRATNATWTPIQSNSGNGTNLVSVTVEAGSYVVDALTTIDGGGNNANIPCHLKQDGTTISSGISLVVGLASTQVSVRATADGIADDTTFTFSCVGYIGEHAHDTIITATQVGALH